MKVKEAPEKLYITYKGYGVFDEDSTVERTKDSQTEYTRTDAFIEKACEWFEQQPETYDANGVRVYGKEDFEDFVNYIKGE